MNNFFARVVDLTKNQVFQIILLLAVSISMIILIKIKYDDKALSKDAKEKEENVYFVENEYENHGINQTTEYFNNIDNIHSNVIETNIIEKQVDEYQSKENLINQELQKENDIMPIVNEDEEESDDEYKIEDDYPYDYYIKEIDFGNGTVTIEKFDD